MKHNTLRNSVLGLAAICGASFFTSCSNQAPAIADKAPAMPGNPFLPLWEHIPDGEPYVFEDPDNPGQQRVYIYGSHDSRLTDYCGRELVVWSAPVDNLMHWRYDGEIFSVNKNANGELLSPDGIADATSETAISR